MKRLLCFLPLILVLHAFSQQRYTRGIDNVLYETLTITAENEVLLSGNKDDLFIVSGWESDIGKLLWTKEFDFPLKPTEMVSIGDTAFALIGEVDTSEQVSVVKVVYFNQYLDTLWTKTYLGSCKNYASSIAAIGSNLFVTHNACGDIHITELNKKGTVIWENRLDSVNLGSKLIEGPDSNLIFGYKNMFGPSKGQITAISINNEGDINWETKLNQLSTLNDITHVTDSSFVLFGDASFSWDTLLTVKLNYDGKVTWNDTASKPLMGKMNTILKGKYNELIYLGRAGESFHAHMSIILFTTEDKNKEYRYWLNNNGTAQNYFNDVKQIRGDRYLLLIRQYPTITTDPRRGEWYRVGVKSLLVAMNGKFELSSIDDQLFPDPIVYPVPSSTHLTIKLKYADNYTFSLLDIYGKEVLVEEVNNKSSTVLDISNLNSGIYFLTIRNDNGAWLIKKIINN